MPYFPMRQEQAYCCQGCRRWFIRGTLSCTVMHAPGTCCHYGETETVPPQPLAEAGAEPPMPQGGMVQ